MSGRRVARTHKGTARYLRWPLLVLVLLLMALELFLYLVLRMLVKVRMAYAWQQYPTFAGILTPCWSAVRTVDTQPEAQVRLRADSALMRSSVHSSCAVAGLPDEIWSAVHPLNSGALEPGASMRWKDDMSGRLAGVSP